jgi:hypothetical protein
MGEAEEGSTIVTKKMLQAWVKTLEKFPTINSLKDILLTFRAMSLMDDKYDASCCYQVNSETGKVQRVFIHSKLMKLYLPCLLGCSIHESVGHCA